MVRRVIQAEAKGGVLRLSAQRLGQTRASKLEICRDRDRRSPSERRTVRALYRRKLERVIGRTFPEWKLKQLSSSSMDLGRSFGPIYARGLLTKGQAAFALLGVNQHETQASIDAALTFGILWLDACRESQSGKTVVEGLQLFVPRGHSALVRERIAHLDANAAKWQLYEFDECENSIVEIDCKDRGNVATRLVHCPDEIAARERFAGPIAQIRELIPEAEAVVVPGAEIAFRLYGLAFAPAFGA